jgi:hypothetical protein
VRNNSLNRPVARLAYDITTDIVAGPSLSLFCLHALVADEQIILAEHTGPGSETLQQAWRIRR